MSATLKRAVLLFCHGSPDPEWARPFTILRERVAARSPGDIAAIAYLAPASPNFEEVVAEFAAAGVREVVVAPMFLARGSHVKKDLPALVAAASATHGLQFTVLPALGEVDSLLDGIATWVVASAIPTDAP